jgi:Trypsin-like peptidase domain
VLFALSFGTSAPTSSQSLLQATKLTGAEVFAKCSPAVVTILTPGGQGSGVVVDASGVIVTSLHVVQGESKATVRLGNGDSYDDVGVIDMDARKDLVLLKVKAFKIASIALGDSDTLAVGAAVFTIGSPKGLELSMSEGIVSALRDSGEGYRVAQTTASISPGSSGGGLFDDRGSLVGITAFKVKGGENLNFAIPINYVRGMLATESRWTLAEMNRRLADAGISTSAGSRTTDVGSVPQLAKVYRSAEGNLAVVEVNGDGSIRISFTATGGMIYGTAVLRWDPRKNAFTGTGTVQTVCGVYDKRIWDAPVEEEIYVVNARVIRERWTDPTKVNCDQRRVISATWLEAFWYVPSSDVGRRSEAEGQ